MTYVFDAENRPLSVCLLSLIVLPGGGVVFANRRRSV
jgi:hypothetical protein